MPELLEFVLLVLLSTAWAIALTALARMYQATGGTTLRAVYWWAMAGISAPVVVEAIALAGRDWTSLGALHFAAAVATFCPLVALLGAKRPQDRAWQFIVVSFWCVLALPAGQALLLRPDVPLRVHPLWSWFVLVLIVVGAANYFPTRLAIPALLFAAGQTLLLWQQLPWGSEAAAEWTSLAGLGLLVAGISAAVWLVPRKRPASQPIDRLWLDFRDWFGAVWGLRIAERINASAAMYDWNVRLSWHGLVNSNQPTDPGQEPGSQRTTAELERSLRTLLRRFVSEEWIEQRLSDVATSGGNSNES